MPISLFLYFILEVLYTCFCLYFLLFFPLSCILFFCFLFHINLEFILVLGFSKSSLDAFSVPHNIACICQVQLFFALKSEKRGAVSYQ